MSFGPHALLALHIRAKRLPKPEHEYRFDLQRKWRLDIAWPDRLIAAEVHGGVYSRGRHTRGKGFTEDRQKINAASLAGWTVFEFTTEMVESGEAVRTLEKVLRGTSAEVAA